MSEIVVTTEWLAEHAEDPHVVIADVRWYLGGKQGADEYAAGHIPGAVFVDVDTDLAAAPGPDRAGRHPLPSVLQFNEVLARIGVTADSIVVAYDDEGGATAARLWWLLRYFGHDIGRVLDGGIGEWVREGRPLEREPRKRERAPRMKLRPRPEMVADRRRLVELLGTPGTLVLDARASERFEGAVEPIDRVAGHIPGARSMPTAANLVAPGGRFLPPDALALRYARLGAPQAETIVCYCGSGVTSCHDVLALALLGRDDAVLYAGGWSDWTSDRSAPVATGRD